MRTRRGTDFWPGELGHMVNQYAPGDIVVSTIVPTRSFIGVVRKVEPKLNKVMVAWGGGSLVQHDPDEIMLSEEAQRMKSMVASDMAHMARRVRSASKKSAMADFPIARFVGEYLRMYSQFQLFHWQTGDYAQHLAFEGANEDMSELMDGFIESYQGKYGRVPTEQSLALFNYGDNPEDVFVEDYRNFLKHSKTLLGGNDDDLANIIDEMVARMNKLLYLLTLE